MPQTLHPLPRPYSRLFIRRKLNQSIYTDSIFLEFLESNRDLPRATSTSALSSASVFRLIGRMGDTVNKMTYKMEETDPWYEDKIVQLDHLELQLKKLYALTEALASSRRDLAIATGHFAASAAVLASTEDSNNLSRYGF